MSDSSLYTRRGRRLRAAAALVLMGIAVAMAPATGLAGDPRGLDRSAVVAHLRDRYAEAPVAMGVTDTGNLVEVFTTATRSTWTIIMTTPEGMSRVIEVGSAWIDAGPPPSI